MTSSIRLLEAANKEIRDLRKGAKNGFYTNREFCLKVDFVRDAIVTLAQRGEFGYVAELSASTTTLLAASENRNSELRLGTEALLYLINTFPSAPAALVNCVSSDTEVNLQIVRSVARSRLCTDTRHMADNFYLLTRLAIQDDLQSWIELAQASMALASQADLVMRAFSRLSHKTVLNNLDQLAFMNKAAVGFSPSYFPIDCAGEKVDFENLLQNLYAIGETRRVHGLINLGTGNFAVGFLIQRYIAQYQFQPKEDYRFQIAKAATVSNPDASQRAMALSLFAYELGTDEPLVKLERAVSPQLLKDILSLDGTNSPYGKIEFLPEKVAQLLDATFRLAVGTSGNDKIYASYAKEIGEKTMLKSNYYKGQKLSDELGM